ncbi:MAG: metal-dependent hydrolase [Candidatus Adiutrix sp.]|jgi:inner membrane protein|nr:metal-dependent hydrolase [Candidatus Adiutrix sp.]
MPTILTHAAPALTLGLALGSKAVPPRLLVVGTALAMAPDLDSIGFFMGVPYESLWGHRGLSHSLAAAGLAGVLGLILAPALKAGRGAAALLLWWAVASHIVLDAATTGGLGPAALWPLEDGRHFLPWRPIRVAPMHPAAMLSGRGLAVMLSELKWVWLPCLSASFLLFMLRRPPAGRKNRFPR